MRVAKSLGAFLQARSGAGKWQKEDFKDHNYLYQIKHIITAKSHTINLAHLEELRRNAIDEERKPCYIIVDEPHGGRKWYLVAEDDFMCIPQS